MELVLAALPLLALLACPLTMMFCASHMLRRRGNGAPSAGDASSASRSREERVAALEGQLTTIQTELAALKTAERVPAASRTRETNRAQPSAVPAMSHAPHRLD